MTQDFDKDGNRTIRYHRKGPLALAPAGTWPKLGLYIKGQSPRGSPNDLRSEDSCSDLEG